MAAAAANNVSTLKPTTPGTGNVCCKQFTIKRKKIFQISTMKERVKALCNALEYENKTKDKKLKKRVVVLFIGNAFNKYESVAFVLLCQMGECQS